MTKVCFVSTSSATYGLLTGEPMTKVGGAELQQSLIAKSLSSGGHDVSFLVHDFGQPDIVSTDQGIRLIKTFGLKKSSLLLRHLKFLRLFAGMSKASADVYYQRAAGFVTGLAALYCRLMRRKFVFAVALDWDVDGTQERSMSRLGRALYRFGVRSADAVLVQTEHQKELLNKRFGRAGVLIRNVYQLPADDDADRCFVLWVANFHAPKRPDMLLEVAQCMPEHQFVMAGRPMPGEEQIYEEIVAAAEKLPNLTVLGPVPYAEIGKLYSQALVFANTSEVEGFPNSFLDAMSRRVPLVATFDPDGIIGKHNLGVHCNTVDEMVAGLRGILSDEELRRQLGENGYRYVSSMHDVSVVSGQYEEVLAGLTSRGKQ